MKVVELPQEVSILAVGLIGPAPPDVLRHGDHRGKVPIDAGSGHLFGGGPPNALHQVRIAGRSQADVVGENDRPPDIGVPMDGICAIEQRNPQSGLQSVLLEAIDHPRPGFGVVRGGIASTTAQNAANRQIRDVLRFDAVLLDLGHLSDLLAQGHAFQQVRHPILNRRLGVAVDGSRLRRRTLGRDRRCAAGYRQQQHSEDDQ
jgi:hypothetical protein